MRKIINRESMEDGFSARFLFTFLHESSSLLKYHEKQAIEASITAGERQTIQNLFQILLHGRESETIFELTQQAEVVLREFHYDLDKEARDAAPYLYSPLRKFKTYALRFSLLIHAINAGHGAIDDQTVLRAMSLVYVLKHNTERAFRLVFQNETEEQQQLILEKIRSMDGTATRDKVKQRLKRQIDYKQCGFLLDNMIKAGVVIEGKVDGENHLCLKLKSS